MAVVLANYPSLEQMLKCGMVYTENFKLRQIINKRISIMLLQVGIGEPSTRSPEKTLLLQKLLSIQLFAVMPVTEE